MNIKIPTDIAPGDYLCKHYGNSQQFPKRVAWFLNIFSSTMRLGLWFLYLSHPIDQRLTPTNKKCAPKPSHCTQQARPAAPNST